MTSNDLIIIEAINGLESRIISLQQDNKDIRKDIRQEIKDTRQELLTEIRVNQVEIHAVHDKINLGFSLMTVFLGVIGGIALLHPAIKALSEYFKDKKEKYATEEKVQEIVEKTVNNALAGKLR